MILSVRFTECFPPLEEARTNAVPGTDTTGNSFLFLATLFKNKKKRMKPIKKSQLL